jgi:membrane-bound lytic murein transglycosylase B
MKIPFLILALFASAPAFATSSSPAVEEAAAIPSLRVRFNDAVEKLRARAQAGGATRADYQAVVDAMK